MARQTWVVKISVDNSWVRDGFNLTPSNINDYIRRILPYAESNELKAKIVSKPDNKKIKKLQGY